MKQNTVDCNHQCQHNKEFKKKVKIPFGCSASGKIENLGRKKFHYGKPLFSFNQKHSAYIRSPELSKYIGTDHGFLKE